MDTTIITHVVAGSIGLIAGFVALYAGKGAPLHRRAGMVFVWSMLAMCTVGVMMAAVRGIAPHANIPAGLVTAFLVVTGLTAVRPATKFTRRVDAVAMLVFLIVGGVSLVFAGQAIANGGTKYGMPAFPYFLFGLVGVFAAAGDIRALRSGPHKGSIRIARHLWRMSFALLIAAMSFFFGQADEFPEPIRIMPLLAVPVLSVLVTMLYWVWRVRFRKSLRGLVTVAQPASVA